MTEKLAKSLSPSEKRIIPSLATGMSVSEVAEKAKVSHVEAMRACQFLSNKGVLTLDKQEIEVYVLTETGQDVVTRGLPEERFIKVLDTPKTLAEIQEQAGLLREEVNAAIGALKKVGAIELGAQVKKLKDISFQDKHDALTHPTTAPPQELVTRGLLEKSVKSTHIITLTALGEKLQKADLSKEYAERLTHDMLKDGS